MCIQTDIFAHIVDRYCWKYQFMLCISAGCSWGVLDSAEKFSDDK